jgi:hypothetical protein
VTGSDPGDEARTDQGRAITILDYVRAVTGDKPSYTGEDHWNAGVGILGGCEICLATIASYNAYPARSGFWRCGDCIGDDGYPTAGEFAATPPADA